MRSPILLFGARHKAFSLIFLILVTWGAFWALPGWILTQDFTA